MTQIRVPDEWVKILNKYKDLGLDLPDPGQDDLIGKDLVQADRKLAKAATDNKVLQAKLAHVKKELEDKIIRETVTSALSTDNGVFSIKATSQHLSESTVVAVASDWHCEERVDPKTLAGVHNEYNLDIFKDRATRFFTKIVYLTEMVRAKTKVDTLVLALLGDFITGYIHEELMENNNLSPTEACVLVKKTIKSGITYLLDSGGFKNLVIPCCYGNHGRTTFKKRISTGATNSYEWLIYKELEENFSTNKRVKFLVADGYHNYVDIYGYTIRFHHGDSISYGGGVGGITIPASKAIAKWNSIKHAYLDVFGHFHQFIDGGNFVANGSLIGYGPYALSIKAAYERPQQAFFVIDKKHGKTVVCPIIVQSV